MQWFVYIFERPMTLTHHAVTYLVKNTPHVEKNPPNFELKKFLKVQSVVDLLFLIFNSNLVEATLFMV